MVFEVWVCKHDQFSYASLDLLVVVFSVPYPIRTFHPFDVHGFCCNITAHPSFRFLIKTTVLLIFEYSHDAFGLMHVPSSSVKITNQIKFNGTKWADVRDYFNTCLFEMHGNFIQYHQMVFFLPFMWKMSSSYVFGLFWHIFVKSLAIQFL